MKFLKTDSSRNNVVRLTSAARQRGSAYLAASLLLTAGACGSDEPAATQDQVQPPGTPDPWALPSAPKPKEYDGPLFQLSHDYPKTQVEPEGPLPWREAIGNGTIDTINASAYTQALKDYVAGDMRTLLFDYPNWNAAAAGWYNVPWLADIEDPIHGTYVGSTFGPDMFPISKLSKEMTTHVLVYYDRVAAGILQNVWGTSGMTPVPGIEAGGAQYAEGSVIVKPAFTTVNHEYWPPMEGAFPWQIWATPGGSSKSDKPTLQDVYLFQFDIIVKDTASSPKTGWVFTTLVYDKSIEGDDPWAKMVPLGAMWGNDPNVISPADCDYMVPDGCPALSETWINPDAPTYAKETLGWGGRLSGPNDAAVDTSAMIQTDSGPQPFTGNKGRLAMSSCMSCHGSAEYQMESFLLPRPSRCNDEKCSAEPVYYQPGSSDFMHWFQDRAGDVPMDTQQAGGGSVYALDYGMNNAFKALPSWFKATGQPGALNFVEEFTNYRGLHPDHDD
ncbi:hypothetical protein WME94_00715 [Sorangium sp. So ce429]